MTEPKPEDYGLIVTENFSPDSISSSSIEFTQRFPAFTNVSEANTNLQIELKRIGNVSIPSSAKFSTVAGTAEAGSDYIDTNEFVTFSPFESRKVLSVSLLDDDLGGQLLRTFEPTWAARRRAVAQCNARHRLAGACRSPLQGRVPGRMRRCG